MKNYQRQVQLSLLFLHLERVTGVRIIWDIHTSGKRVKFVCLNFDLIPDILMVPILEPVLFRSSSLLQCTKRKEKYVLRKKIIPPSAYVSDP